MSADGKRRTPKCQLDGAAAQEPERPSDSATLPALAPHLSESQIGVNYMLQMEDLLPEEAIADEETASGTDMGSVRVLSSTSSQYGTFHPLANWQSEHAQSCLPPSGHAVGAAGQERYGEAAVRRRSVSTTLPTATVPDRRSRLLPPSLPALSLTRTTTSDSNDLAHFSRSTFNFSGVPVASDSATTFPTSLSTTQATTSGSIRSGATTAGTSAASAAHVLGQPPRLASSVGPQACRTDSANPLSLGEETPACASRGVQREDADPAGAGASRRSSAVFLSPEECVQEALPCTHTQTDPTPLAGGAGGHPDVSHEVASEAARVGSPLPVSAILATAVIRIVGVLLVAIVGFMPVYITGFRAVDDAFSVLQTQATSGIISASAAPIFQLPEFAATLLARTAVVGGDGHGGGALGATPAEALFSLSSALRTASLQDFLGSLQFVDATPGHEWRVMVSNQNPHYPLVGMLQTTADSPNQTVVYPLDSVSFHRNLEKPLITVNVFLRDAIYVNGSLGYLESTLWSTSVVRLVSARLTHALRKSGRYFVVDPQTRLVVANSWNQSLHALPRGAQHFFSLHVEDIADPLAAAAVQQLTTMGFLGPPGTTAGTRGRQTTVKFPFGADTAWMQVLHHASPRAVGFNVVFVVVTLEGDYFASVYQTRTIMVCVMVVVVLMVAAGSYLSASYVVRSLNRLIDDLEATKNLQFDVDSVSASCEGLSVFTELLHVQLAYAQLQQQLMALKAFLPDSLLVPTTDFTEGCAADASGHAAATVAAAPGEGDASHSSAAPVNLDGSMGALTRGGRGTSELSIGEAPLSLHLATCAASVGELAPPSANNASGSQSEIVTAPIPGNPTDSLNENLRISRKWREDMRLNTKIFNEQVNVYHRRYCTMLFVCRYYTQEVDYGSLSRYFSACYAAAAEFNGCLEFLRPDYAVITFGAHTQMPMHATRATQCALAIYNTIPPDERDKVNYVVDSNEFLVGTCGAVHGKKGRVVFDVMHLIGLIRVCRTLGYHGVIVTQSTASRLPDYQSVPMDRVYEEAFLAPLVICEVRVPGQGVSVAQLAQTAKRFREAFHYMTNGQYRRARRVYRRIGPNDATAVRLARTCQQRIAQGDRRGFVTVRAQPHMNLLSAILKSKHLAPFHRMKREYQLQLLGGGVHFRPGLATPPRAEQGITGLSEESRPSPQHSGHPPRKVRRRSPPRGVSPSGNTHDGAAAAGEGGRGGGEAVPPPHGTRRDSSMGEPFEEEERRVSDLSTRPPAKAARGQGVVDDGGPTVSANVSPSADPVADGPLSASRTSALGSTSTHGTAINETGDDRENDVALFEWIGVASECSSQALPDGGGAGTGARSPSNPYTNEESLVFVDDNGRHWSRSINKISDGAFSVVYLGMSEDGVQVAIKCIPRRRRDIKEDHVRAEMRMMAELRHPNIVQYIGFCATQTHLPIIMEYVPGGSLFAFTQNFGKLDVIVARRFLLDILSGLSYLHARNIVHCDVKPHNMLLGVNGVCKLSDFGSTVSEATDFAKSDREILLRGTALYMAPEVARGERCTPQSDIYSLGVTLLEMLLGHPPWRWSCTGASAREQTPLKSLYQNDARFVQLLSRGDVTPHIPDNLDCEVYSLCQACCQADPSKRPGAEELMSFPFVL